MPHRILPAALLVLVLLQRSPAQPGPLGPGGGQQTDLHPEDPAQTADRTRRSAEKAMQKGQEYRAKGHIQEAATSFKNALTFALTPGPANKPVDSGIAHAAVDQLKQLYDEGKQKLDAARKLYEDGKYVPARDAADKIKKFYAALLSSVPGGSAIPNLANLAVDLIHQIESDPKAIPILQQTKAAPLIKKLARLDREAKRDPSKRLDVYQLLQTLSEKYPKSEAGRNAAVRLADLRQNAAFMAWVETETDARRLRSELALAEQYSKNGQPEKADAIYEKLLQRYPGKTLDDLKSMARKPVDLTAAPPRD